ncbi:hypothetical protein CTI12_AA160020 [Artemisia annua]|uniref:Uncharacterized protein n=1 Tax=Artemisia annua TaxID=35608 RepID=A0A2U1PEJ2_ARTAN|nr:hypothetical protein CTI12_AA160020 [Artemisia annua]
MTSNHKTIQLQINGFESEVIKVWSYTTWGLTEDLTLVLSGVDFASTDPRYSVDCVRIVPKMRRMLVDIALPPKWKQLWETWDLQGFIILSLSLQTFLILFAPFRKRTNTN